MQLMLVETMLCSYHAADNEGGQCRQQGSPHGGPAHKGAVWVALFALVKEAVGAVGDGGTKGKGGVDASLVDNPKRV